jgi:hypothetical protein
MNEWGVSLHYLIWHSVFSDYNDMADKKAYLESIARSFVISGRDKSEGKYNFAIASNKSRSGG